MHKIHLYHQPLALSGMVPQRMQYSMLAKGQTKKVRCHGLDRKLNRSFHIPRSAASPVSVETTQELGTIAKYFRNWVRKSDIDTGKVDVVA